MNLQLFGNGGDREQELRNAMLAALTETTNQLASTLYTHTWKTRTTPDGNQIISLRASQAKREGQSPWPTPVAEPANGTPEAFLERKRRSVAKTGRSMGIVLTDLAMVSQLAAWPTPQSTDIKMANRGAEATENEWNREHRGNNLALYAQHLAAWMTPKATDGEFTTPRTSGRPMEKSTFLQTQAIVQTTNHAGSDLPPLFPARLTASGVMLTGSDAGMDGGGQLNPALPRWLQAIPAEWGQAALEAHQKLKANKGRASTRTKQRRSQKA